MEVKSETTPCDTIHHYVVQKWPNNRVNNMNTVLLFLLKKKMATTYIHIMRTSTLFSKLWFSVSLCIYTLAVKYIFPSLI